MGAKYSPKLSKRRAGALWPPPALCTRVGRVDSPAESLSSSGPLCEPLVGVGQGPGAWKVFGLQFGDAEAGALD